MLKKYVLLLSMLKTMEACFRHWIKNKKDFLTHNSDIFFSQLQVYISQFWLYNSQLWIYIMQF